MPSETASLADEDNISDGDEDDNKDKFNSLLDVTIEHLNVLTLANDYVMMVLNAKDYTCALFCHIRPSEKIFWNSVT